MKLVAISLAASIMVSLAATGTCETIVPGKVDLLTAANNSKVYKIEDGEATVSGSLIKRIVLGKTSATVSYFNKTNAAQKPGYSFRLINAYGIEVAEFRVNWVFSSIGIDEASAEEVRLSQHRLDKILEFSTVALPGNWSRPAYLLIENGQP